MEVAMTRADVEERREATMARFLRGLNSNIRDIVELQPYVDMEELLHLAQKVEKQQKRKNVVRSSYGSGSSSSNAWKSNTFRREEKAPIRPKEEEYRRKGDVKDGGKAVVQPQRSRDIKCYKCLGVGHYAYQCPNRQTMILREGGYETEVEEDETDVEKSSEGSDVEYAEHGSMLVIWRTLNAIIKEDKEVEQRENIFHTRCLMKGKLCSIIIDGGSC